MLSYDYDGLREAVFRIILESNYNHIFTESNKNARLS